MHFKGWQYIIAGVEQFIKDIASKHTEWTVEAVWSTELEDMVIAGTAAIIAASNLAD